MSRLLDILFLWFWIIKIHLIHLEIIDPSYSIHSLGRSFKKTTDRKMDRQFRSTQESLYTCKRSFEFKRKICHYNIVGAPINKVKLAKYRRQVFQVQETTLSTTVSNPHQFSFIQCRFLYCVHTQSLFNSLKCLFLFFFVHI